MLRISELRAALDMTRSLGQRRYGHFDHDAHSATGPFPPSPCVAEAAPPPAPSEGGFAEDRASPLEQFIDAATKQPLFRQREESQSE